MRAIKTLADVQLVLNQHDTFISSVQSKDLDRKGLKVVNAGDASAPQDYVTLSQMQDAIKNASSPSTAQQDQHYTMVWSEDGVVTTGQQLPAFLARYERTGLPIAVSVLAIGSPSGGNLTVNIYAGLTITGGVNILSTDLVFPPGQQTVVASSQFINPVPYIGSNYIVYPIITNGAGASIVTITVVLKRTKNA